jgi:hypothetical protein
MQELLIQGYQLIKMPCNTSHNRFTGFVNIYIAYILSTFFFSLAPQPSLGLGILRNLLPLKIAKFLGGFSTIFLQGRVVSTTPNPHPGGPGLCIYIPQRQDGPVIPPGTGYPF